MTAAAEHVDVVSVGCSPFQSLRLLLLLPAHIATVVIAPWTTNQHLLQFLQLWEVWWRCIIVYLIQCPVSHLLAYSLLQTITHHRLILCYFYLSHLERAAVWKWVLPSGPLFTNSWFSGWKVTLNCTLKHILLGCLTRINKETNVFILSLPSGVNIGHSVLFYVRF